MRRVGRIADRRAEKRHHRVAHELVERAVLLEDDVGHVIEVVVEHPHHLVGGRVLGIAGEPGDVGEQDGQLARLAAQPQQAGIVHHAARQGRRQIAVERLGRDPRGGVEAAGAKQREGGQRQAGGDRRRQRRNAVARGLAQIKHAEDPADRQQQRQDQGNYGGQAQKGEHHADDHLKI